jgi:hypothetical protein
MVAATARVVASRADDPRAEDASVGLNVGSEVGLLVVGDAEGDRVSPSEVGEAVVGEAEGAWVALSAAKHSASRAAESSKPTS